MSANEDRARLIAERVARRVAGHDADPSKASDRENGFEAHELSLRNESRQPPETPRARVIDFVAAGPPLRTTPSIGQPRSGERAPEQVTSNAPEFFQFVPVTQSPWLGRLPAMLGQDNPQSAVLNPKADHPSEQRFGVEEATVAELVEFFEKEKQCAMDPSGKPCDHCAMCSSRGF